jgi:hypothetical protein
MGAKGFSSYNSESEKGSDPLTLRRLSGSDLSTETRGQTPFRTAFTILLHNRMVKSRAALDQSQRDKSPLAPQMVRHANFIHRNHGINWQSGGGD